MIMLDQAHYDQIVNQLGKLNIRGFTAWKEVYGKGSSDGIPHYGSHAWPSVNNSILTMVEDDKVAVLLKYLKEQDEDAANLGLRAFVWNVEDMI